MPKLKIILDECLDRRLAKEIPGHLVKTVPEMGWAGLKNGMLLSKAQEEFDIFITSDQNLSFQQNLSQYNIAILVLCPATNQLNDLQFVLSKALKKLLTLKSGRVVFIRV